MKQYGLMQFATIWLGIS